MNPEGFNPNPDAPAAVDYMTPAAGTMSLGGNYARRLLDNELDVGAMRPYIGKDGRSRITRNVVGPDGKITPKSIVTNDTNATLRTLDWIQLDEAVIRAAKPRLRAVRDLREAGLVYSLPNGIAKTVLQSQAVSDISGAVVSMDGLRQSEADRPVFSTVNFPLPIIHKDFQFGLREVLASRTGYSPLDVTTAELAGRRVAEQAEQFLLGSSDPRLLGQPSYFWDNAAVYGYMTYPGRITYSLTLPTVGGWTPSTTVNDIILMKQAAKAEGHFGPFMVYTGLYWDPYMDEDYKATYNDMTLRERIGKLDGILGVRTVDYINTSSIIMVQMTTDVVRLIIGMDITTLQWESHGGMQLNFKVMCVIVPQLRGDFYGNTGIVHGS